MTTLVIGAGAAGTGAAHVCPDATVCEASDGVGGRLESRSRDGAVYDLGVPDVPATGDERSTLVEAVLGPDAAPFEGRVAPVVDGTVGEPCPAQPHRITARHGVESVARRILDSSHVDHRAGTAVRSLVRTDDGWRAHTDAGAVEADRVVATPGPDEVASLLADDDPLLPEFIREAARVDHRLRDAVALGYDRAVDRDWYGLAPDDGDVFRVARESAKPGHVPADREVLVVHLGHDWAAEHGPTAAVARAAREAADLLDEDRLREPAWTDHERYRYAAPSNRAEPGLVTAADDADLHLAGGWVAGTDRTFAPLETGLDAGRRAMGFDMQTQFN